ncbi:MAG: GNAT family N-acetyltransferase [Spirulina sp. SIO3F2]|nr:GNAT family N-acetyltransferase [Spirulina sp. SIO3F2]
MIQLRPTQSIDLDFVRQAERDPENRPFILQWTLAEHEAALQDPDMSHQIIEQASSQDPVGYTILRGLANAHRSLELKRLVVTQKGQGYGQQALRRIQQQVFEQYKAHRLWLDVKEFNKRAYDLYRKVGFVEEGRLRDCWRTELGFETVVVMSMLEDEYRQQLLQ